ncbi:MAG: PKD domain-containing protein, partial [Candidatus Bathyarchaeota archaeon]
MIRCDQNELIAKKKFSLILILIFIISVFLSFSSEIVLAPPDKNKPPIADPGGPYSGVEGTPIVLDGSNSSDPDGDELSYTWSIEGSIIEGQTVSHTFLQNGTYFVTLQVRDGEHEQPVSDTAFVTVNDSDPLANFIASPTGGV